MKTGLIKGNINLGVFYWNNIKTTPNNNKVKGLNNNTALILLPPFIEAKQKAEFPATSVTFNQT